jgi:hypothetical protein
LQGSSVGGSGSNDCCVGHGTESSQSSDDVCNCRSLLTDCNVNAVQFLCFVVGDESILLVNDCVDGDSSLTSLSISNNQLSLASSDWHQGVD